MILYCILIYIFVNCNVVKYQMENIMKTRFIALVLFLFCIYLSNLQSEIRIIQQPKDTVIVCAENEVYLSVLIDSSGLSLPIDYDWHRVYGQLDETIENSNSPQLTFMSNYADQNLYYVVIRSGNETVTSDTALFIANAKPHIAFGMELGKPVEKGKMFSLFAGTENTIADKFEWFLKGEKVYETPYCYYDLSIDEVGTYFFEVRGINECGVGEFVPQIIYVVEKLNVENENINQEMIKIIPNPVSENATIKFNNIIAKNSNVLLTDILGNKIKEIYNGSIDSEIEININTKDLSSGMYNIIINTNSETITQRLFVTK